MIPFLMDGAACNDLSVSAVMPATRWCEHSYGIWYDEPLGLAESTEISASPEISEIAGIPVTSELLEIARPTEISGISEISEISEIS